MNPLSPILMTPLERRAALCAILALGLVRLRQRELAQHAARTGEFPLHYPAVRCRHATRNPTDTA